MSPGLFYDKLVCRTSLFPIEKELEEIINNSSDYQVFMQAVYFSSPEFYDLMVHSVQQGALSKRTLGTLIKYFKRTKFRSTPFGLFGGVGVLKWKQKDLMVRDKFSLQYDLESKAKICLDERFRRLGDFYLNPTIYRRKNEFRYYGYELGDRIYFKLKSLTVTKELSKMLKNIGEGNIVSYGELLGNFNGPSEDFDYFIEELVDSQIILSTNRSIIGDSYAEQKRSSNIEMMIQKMLLELNKDQADFGTYLEHNKYLQKRIPGLFSNRNGFHAVRVDQYSHEIISKNHQQKILQAYRYVREMINPQASTELDHFVRKFNTWYESQVIPLMQLFDPDSGFDDFISLRSDLVKYSEQQPASEPNLIDNKIFNRIYRPNQPVFEVEDEQKDRSEEPNRLIAAKFQLFDGDMLYVERFLGKSPLSYISRFSGCHAEISQLWGEIGSEHYVDSENYIYAEIISVSEYVSLNVINAPVVCNHAIRIFEAPAQQKDNKDLQTLSVNDLMVGIRNNRPILFSKKLNKVVIPVLTNAYNYNRSELPIYKFLCSLARNHEGVDLDFGSNLLARTHHRHIPRIVLNKRIILSKEKWIVTLEDLRQEFNIITAASFVSGYGKVKAFFGLKEHLEIVSQDRNIHIDSKISDDLILLAKELFKRETLVLEESLFSNLKSAVKDRDGQSFYHELLCFFKTGQEKPSISAVPSFNERSIFYPFEQGWLYLKIYCNHSIANKILTMVYGMLAKNSPVVQKWFYIRYEDPEFHLRIRIKFLKEDQAMKFYHDLLKLKLENRDFRLNVFDLALSSYQREVIRYPRIELAEELFNIDSNFTLAVIKRGNIFTERDMLVLIVHSIKSYFSIFSLEKSKCVNCLEVRRQDLKSRYALKNESFTELFSHSRNGWQAIHKLIRLPFKNREVELVKAAQQTQGLMDPYKFFVDMIHLLCNRLLEVEQNQKEFVVLTLLLKHLRSPNSGSFGL